jgi:hypothetical protein
MAFNVAMRFSERGLEVPHEYLVGDREATTRRQEQAAGDGAVLGHNMAVVGIALADARVAKRRLHALGGRGAALLGVEEADVIALYVAATGQPWTKASGLPVFEYEHHGAWLRLPAPMTAAIARTSLDPNLVKDVDAIASLLRSRPNAGGQMTLSLAALRTIVGTCQRAKGRTVFLYVSE